MKTEIQYDEGLLADGWHLLQLLGEGLRHMLMLLGLAVGATIFWAPKGEDPVRCPECGGTRHTLIGSLLQGSQNSCNFCGNTFDA